MGSDRDDALFRVETHLDRVRRCQKSWKDLPLPTATPDGKRYPLVYPRDTAVITRALERVHAAGAAEDGEMSRALEGAAGFLVSVQGPDGLWGQRYTVEGEDRGIYPQEDNTAHAVATIARHLLHERSGGQVSPMEADGLDAIGHGLQAALRHHDPDVGLYRSTTSVHESSIERGFTLWTNGAYWDALGLATRAARAAERHRDADALEARQAALLEAIRAHLIREGAFIRRLTPERVPDARPDITLLAPSYFGFAEEAADAEARAVEHLVRELWHPELGLLCRYPDDPEDPGIHQHGGHGPYLSFSCWLAQRHALRGRGGDARRVLEQVAAFATPDGDLPEHVATEAAFDAFMERQWRTGRDLRKELDPDILRSEVAHEALLAEAERMVAAYRNGLRWAERAGDGVVRLAAPHAWTHADFAAALVLCRDD